MPPRATLPQLLSSTRYLLEITTDTCPALIRARPEQHSPRAHVVFWHEPGSSAPNGLDQIRLQRSLKDFL